VAVVLRDRNGAPLPGAAVTVEAFHNARAGQIVTASLSDAGDGLYRAQVPIARSGLWELRFRAVRGAHVFTRTVAGEVVP
jgi:nitrogen fixation protein FixH